MSQSSHFNSLGEKTKGATGARQDDYQDGARQVDTVASTPKARATAKRGCSGAPTIGAHLAGGYPEASAGRRKRAADRCRTRGRTAGRRSFWASARRATTG